MSLAGTDRCYDIVMPPARSTKPNLDPAELPEEAQSLHNLPPVFMWSVVLFWNRMLRRIIYFLDLFLLAKVMHLNSYCSEGAYCVGVILVIQ